MNGMDVNFYLNDQLLQKVSFAGSEAKTLSIGKQDADIVLPADGVSRMHAQLLYDGNAAYLIDCNSTNGTFVNGKRLKENEPYKLKAHDTASFDRQKKTKLLLRFNTDGNVADDADDQFKKTIFYQLSQKNEILIGRSPDCDIVLPHHAVSRKHASVKKTAEGKYIVTDEGSLNGIFVNGKKVKTAEINSDDQLYIGRFKLSLQETHRNLSNESAVRANYISKQYKNGFKALKETTFDIPSGGVVAIMGPSGCGKSTLLKVLNGTIFPTKGSVFINGLDLFTHFPYLKTQIGYVPQDDIVHKELTVRQSIYYAAKIRLNNAPDEVISKKTAYLLEKLNISAISDNLVSGISGGQRKRVSIAIELLSEPAVLFLDEPTSPLDPQTIDEFMKILRSLSEAGTTVIMVTHKPEDLNYMDRVIFMAEGGSLVFYGNTGEYRSYFNVTTAIEVYSNISGEKASVWITKFSDNAAKHDPMPFAAPKRKDGRANHFTQFYWLLRRYAKIKLNDKKNTAIMILQAPIIALLICLIFKEIRLSVMFLMSISAIWFGVNNSAREIVSEDAIYKRERMFNILIFPYIFSKITVLLFFAVIQAVFFVLIIAACYSSHHVFWEEILTGISWMTFLTFCSSLLGLFISAANSNTEKAMSVVPIIIIPQIMLAGVVTPINNSIVELLSYFTVSRWGTEGFTHIQKNVMENIIVPVKMIPGQQEKIAHDVIKTSFHETFKITFGTHAGSFHLDVIILSVMCALYLVCTWLFLLKKDASRL